MIQKIDSGNERQKLFADYGIDEPYDSLPSRARQRLRQRLKPHMDVAMGAYKIAKEELKSDVRLTLKETFRAWVHGFSRVQYALYGLGGNDPGQYVPNNVQSAASARANGRAGKALKNKLFFSAVLKGLGAPCPNIRAIILKGEVCSLDGSNRRGNSLIKEALEENPNEVVLKPSQGYKGIGIAFLRKDGDDYLLNGRITSCANVCSLLSLLDNYLVTDFIVQHEYASRMYPKTTNTIRLLTLWDPDAKIPFIVSPVHRIGTSRSYPVDNFKAGLGGLTVPVDLESGVLGEATYQSASGDIERTASHPETGSRIKGVKVPLWPETTAQILRLAASIPYLQLVAWDVVITPAGFCVIEANPGAGLAVHQVIGPLLEDPRARRFYESHELL